MDPVWRYSPGDGILIPAVLLEASSLVEDVRWVLGIDEQGRQNGDPFGVVSGQAGFASLSLLALPALCRSG